MMKTLLIVAMLAVPAAQAAFRCKDEKGTTYIGDAPPTECANVVVFEVSKTGAVIRRIEPSLTGERLQAKLQEDTRAAEAAKAASDQKRKDQALLATYGAEKDFGAMRDLNLKPIETGIRNAQARIAAIEKRQKELDDEMEFYKAGKSSAKAPGKAREPPAQLVTDIERLRNEKVSLTASIARSEKDKAAVIARFEADRNRWLELKQARGKGKSEPSDAKSAEASKPGMQDKQPKK